MVEAVRIMVYVRDVGVVKQFWVDYFKPLEVREEVLPEGYVNVVITLKEGIELSLFPIPFIEKYSPEVLGNTPSLMLSVADLDGYHDALPAAGDIVMINGDRLFNVPDPEGHYVVLREFK